MLTSRFANPALLFVALTASVLGAACVDEELGWQAIYETSVAPNCAASACHSEYAQTAGIDLSSQARAFETLTGRPCGADTDAVGLVNPAFPSESYLVILLRREDSFGMPPNRRLGDVEISDIEAWIERGAPCD